MPDLEHWLLALTLLGLLLGGWSIIWARTSPTRLGIVSGRILFIGTLMALGGTSSIAALLRADGLAPLGLSAGVLVVGMLWEVPPPAGSQSPRLPLAEEM